MKDVALLEVCLTPEARTQLSHEIAAWLRLPGESSFPNFDRFPHWGHQIKAKLAGPLALIIATWLQPSCFRASAMDLFDSLHGPASRREVLVKAVRAIQESFAGLAIMFNAIAAKRYPLHSAYMSLQDVVMTSRDLRIRAWSRWELATPNFSGLLQFAESRVLFGSPSIAGFGALHERSHLKLKDIAFTTSRRNAIVDLMIEQLRLDFWKEVKFDPTGDKAMKLGSALRGMINEPDGVLAKMMGFSSSIAAAPRRSSVVLTDTVIDSDMWSLICDCSRYFLSTELERAPADEEILFPIKAADSILIAAGLLSIDDDVSLRGDLPDHLGPYVHEEDGVLLPMLARIVHIFQVGPLGVCIVQPFRFVADRTLATGACYVFELMETLVCVPQYVIDRLQRMVHQCVANGQRTCRYTRRAATDGASERSRVRGKLHDADLKFWLWDTLN